MEIPVDEAATLVDTNEITNGNSSVPADMARKRRMALRKQQQAKALAQQQQQQQQAFQVEPMTSWTATAAAKDDDQQHLNVTTDVDGNSVSNGNDINNGSNHDNGSSNKKQRFVPKYVPDVPMTKEQTAAWRREARRVRNRQSAAASRQKTRHRITELEEQCAFWETKYKDLVHKISKYEQKNDLQVLSELLQMHSNDDVENGNEELKTNGEGPLFYAAAEQAPLVDANKQDGLLHSDLTTNFNQPTINNSVNGDSIEAESRLQEEKPNQERIII